MRMEQDGWLEKKPEKQDREGRLRKSLAKSVASGDLPADIGVLTKISERLKQERRGARIKRADQLD
ncbi:MAG: hypothetical protein WC745_04220 [Patescibacteria group bacterium]